jgi:hypothetical protein
LEEKLEAEPEDYGARQGIAGGAWVIQGVYKLSEYFVPVAVCTGTIAVVCVQFSSLCAPVSSTVDWFSAQITWGCE